MIPRKSLSSGFLFIKMLNIRSFNAQRHYRCESEASKEGIHECDTTVSLSDASSRRWTYVCSPRHGCDSCAGCRRFGRWTISPRLPRNQGKSKEVCSSLRVFTQSRQVAMDLHIRYMDGIFQQAVTPSASNLEDNARFRTTLPRREPVGCGRFRER